MKLKIRVFTIFLGLNFGLLATASQAHTELIKSNPVAGSTISQLPKQIELTFSEPPLVAGSYVIIEQFGLRATHPLKGTLVGSKLIFDRPKVLPGEVNVIWRAVADDGHVESGQFAFTYLKDGISKSPEPEVKKNIASRQIVIWAGMFMLLSLIAGIIFTARRKS